MRRRKTARRLDELDPHWVDHGGDWGAGVYFRCARHGNHQVWIMFANPLGGLLPRTRGKLYRRLGTSFSTLSVVELLQLGVCFTGWLVDGDFLEMALVH